MAKVSSCNREPTAHKGCSMYLTENVCQPLAQTWRTQCSWFGQKRTRGQGRSISLAPLTCPGTVREVWHPKFSASPLPGHYTQAPSPSTNKGPAQNESTIHIHGADPGIHLRPEQTKHPVCSFLQQAFAESILCVSWEGCNNKQQWIRQEQSLSSWCEESNAWEVSPNKTPSKCPSVALARMLKKSYTERRGPRVHESPSWGSEG